MKTKKFTEEQLSRILSAHEGGQLKVGGRFFRDEQSAGCCINQAAMLIPKPLAAYLNNEETAEWFDKNYMNYQTADEILHELENRGWA